MPVVHSGGESPTGEPIVKLSNGGHHHAHHHHHDHLDHHNHHHRQQHSGTSEDGCEGRMIGGGCAAGGAVAALCADDEHVLRGCAGCGSKISERFLLHALDKYWHITCLKCSSCNATLADIGSTCFTRAGMVLCKDDYARMFAVKRCARCHLGISANELVMRARDLVYHLHCFNCASCNKALTKGEQFGMKDNMVYCRLHYEMLSHEGDYVELDGGLYRTQASRSMPAYYNGVGTVQKGRPRKRKNAMDVSQATPTADGHHAIVTTPALENLPNGGDLCNLEGGGSGGYDTTPSTPNPGGSHTPRTKRMRTSFKHHQLRTMKSYFALNQNPDAKDLKQLAQKTGLSKRVLQVWFQNARAKWRRNMMRQEGQAGEKSSGDPSSAVSELGGSGSHLGDPMSSTPTPLGDISGGTLTSDSQSPHSLTFGDLY